MADSNAVGGLKWVKDEIVTSLQRVRGWLEELVDCDGDQSHLNDAVTALSEVRGVLSALQLIGPVRLTEEMQTLCEDLQAQSLPNRDEAAEALMLALIQLPDYLDKLEAGQADVPMTLLPSINDLRGSRGAVPLSEAELLVPASVLADTEIPAADVQRLLGRIAPKIRPHFHLYLLQWFRDDTSRQGLVGLGRLFHRLQRHIGAGIFHELFLVAEAVAEALLDGSIAADSRTKALVAHLDRVIRAFATDPDAWPESTAQSQLFDLLSLIARCESSSYRVKELRSVYGLEQAAEDGEPVPPSLATRPSPAALGVLVAETRKELMPIKEALDLFARGNRGDRDRLSGLEQQLRNLANTLAVSGADDLVDRLRRSANALGAMGRGSVPSDDKHLMTIAEELLTVEAALGDLSLHENLLPGHADIRALRARTLDEARAEMAMAEQTIANLVDMPTDSRALAGVPEVFHRVAGALRVVAENDAARVLDLVAENLERRFLGAGRAPVQVELELLAQAISGIDLYMVGLAEGEPYRSDLVARARRAVEELSEVPMPSSSRTIDAMPPAGEEPDVEAIESSVPIKPATPIDPEFLDVFLEEAEEEEKTIRYQFARWRKDEGDEIALTTIRRSFHTLKGSGRLVGALRIGELSRAVEMLLNRMIDGTLGASTAVKAFMDDAVATLPDLIVAEAREQPLDIAELIARAESLAMAAPGEVGVSELRDTEPKTANVIPWPAPAGVRTDETAPTVNSGEAQTEAAEEEIEEIAALAEADDELLDIFRTEAREHLAVLRTYCDRGKEDVGPAIPDESVVRALHTLTGSARMTGVLSTARVTAPLERLFQDQLSRDAAPDNSLLTDLGSAIDAVESRLTHIPGYGGEMPTLRDLAVDLEVQIALLESGGSARDTLSTDGPETLREDAQPAPDSRPGPVSEGEIIALEIPAEPAPGEEVPSTESSEDIELEEEAFSAEAAEEIVLDFETLPGGASEEIVLESGMLLGGALEEIVPELETLSGEASEEIMLEQETLSGEVSEEIVLESETILGGASEEVVPEPETLSGEVAEEFVPELETLSEEAAAEIVLDDGVVSIESPADFALDEEGAVPVTPEEIPMADDNAAAITAFSDVDGQKDVAPIPAPAPPVKRVAPETWLPDQDAPAIAAQGFAPLQQDQELIALFLEDARDIGDQLDRSLRDLQLAPTEPGPLDEMQRSLHTLKGSARLSGLAPIGDLSHAFESLLTAITRGEARVDDDILELAQRTLDTLSDQIDAVEQRAELRGADDLVQALSLVLQEGLGGEPEAVPDVAVMAPSPATAGETGEGRAPSFIDMIERGKPGAGATAEVAAPQIRVRSDLLNRLVNNSGEISIYRSRLSQQGGLMSFRLGELDRTVDRLRDQLRHLEIETEAQILHRYERDSDALVPSQAGFDPLELDRFSTLQQLSRSLAETVNDLGSLRTLLQDLQGESDTLLQQQARVAEDLQDGLLRTRMVPFVQAVPRLHRVVRQTAQQLGKEARLEVFGPEVELDRSIQRRMLAPLEHLLRNAVAHGIEVPEERKRVGKPAAGVVSLMLNREGNDVVITLADDGAGLDLDAIRRRAVDSGRMSESAEAGEDELAGLILEAGFSTVNEVSQIAGRGVGLDVVNAEVKQLSGALGLETQPGRGTSFTIRLPLTLAIVEALLVQIGDQVFAIPQATIEAASRINQADLHACYQGMGEDISYAGHDYRVMYLGSMLQLAGVPNLGERRWLPVLLARSGDQRIAFHVDQLLGTQRVVVKPLGPELSSIRWLSGGTILPDGRVAMILDLLALIRSAAVQEYRPPMQMQPEEQKRRPCVLVVDDSLTVRRVTSRMLRRQNIEAITATDGIDALTRLEERVPDAILLDIEMPRMDGYELTRHIRRSERFKKIPVIMITSRTGDKHRRHALELGVDRYLGKPYQEAELLDEISSVLVEAML